MERERLGHLLAPARLTDGLTYDVSVESHYALFIHV